ncbi:MAG: hypothetical protein JXB05_02440 [Myxococcaceae bacterium]|nr:hypothetical protein [Myxococcaceae bacterium]
MTSERVESRENPFRGRERPRLVPRAMTGHEEEWVERRGAEANTARLCNEVLARCLAPPGADCSQELERVRALLVAQRDEALLQLRRLSLGDTVQTQARCPACRAVVEVDFPLSRIPLPSTAAPARVEVALEEGGRAVMRLPTAGDQEALLDAALKTEAERRTWLLSRVLLRLGDSEGPFSEESTRGLSTPTRAALERALEEALPDLDLSMSTGCPECGHAFSAPFDVPAFFLPR